MHADAATPLAPTVEPDAAEPVRREPVASKQPENESATVSAWRAVLPAYLVSRLGLLLIGYVSLRMVPLGPNEAPWQFLPDDALFDGLVRWDSGWYRSVLYWGYYYDGLTHENIHYFPVYPLLVGGLMTLIPKRVSADAAFAYSAVFVSHAAFYLGLAGVYTLARLKSHEHAAKRCVWLLCLFPYSFFYSAAYTESTYLALSVWAFVHAERRQWARASLLAALAGGTRIPGLFVGASIAGIYFTKRQCRGSALGKEALWLLIAPLGCLLYAAYLGVRFNDPLLLVRVSTNLPGHYVRGIFMHIAHVFGQSPDFPMVIERTTVILSLLSLAFVLGMSVAAGRLFGSAYAWFPLASIALASLYTLDANGRYISVLFPVFMAAAVTLPAPIYRAACVVSAPVGGALFVLFAHWRHIT